MDRAVVDRHSRIGMAEVTEDSQTTNRAVISRRAAIGGAIAGRWSPCLHAGIWRRPRGGVRILLLSVCC